MPEDRKLVMVTNDDGVHSEGLTELARAASKHADVVIVAPDQPQSATALSLTFHKPLRVTRLRRSDFETYAVSGSPGDCVMIGVNKLLRERPQLVVSGINIGDNNTYQDVLASGTVAAALESVITGIPAIAFSMEVEEESLFALEYSSSDFVTAAKVAGNIVGDVLDHGMPRGADLLNVNFPARVSASTKVALTHVARRKYTDSVIVRKDPRGRPYYWLFGQKLPSFPVGSDAKAVLVDREVSITPVKLDLSGPITEDLESLRRRLEKGRA